MNYLQSYMAGLDNTPSYNYENNKINSDVLESYSKFILEHPNSITGNLIKKYQKTLKENNNTMNDSVFKKIDDIYREAAQYFNLVIQ
ncbi:MAG: hypothetical protein M1308_08565 [Actinobacteria bacterium]|nr:hypothetical protein [Actinomycetota bacterium]